VLNVILLYHQSMTPKKQRITVTVDPELIEAAHRAVADGRADSVSGWVGAALIDRVAKDRRLLDLGKAVEAYEVEFGEITVEELAAQARADREAAVIVRGRRPAVDGRSRRGPKAASA
jgi:hypothetical protein